MAAAPVRGPAVGRAEGQGRAAGAPGPGSTTAVEWSVTPWQELPIPRSPGASAVTTDRDEAGTGVKARTADAAGTSARGAPVTDGEQQKNTAMRTSTQPSTTDGATPPRRRSVRSVRLVIAAIVRVRESSMSVAHSLAG